MEHQREDTEQEPGLVSWCDRLYSNMPAFRDYIPRPSRRALLTSADDEDGDLND